MDNFIKRALLLGALAALAAASDYCYTKLTAMSLDSELKELTS